MKKKTVILFVAAVLCLISTVALWFAVDKSNPEYEEVAATVLSSRNKTKRVLGKRMTVREVQVEYEGETYDLKNVYNTSSYRPGQDVTAYLSKGNLYANTAGVKTSTPLSKAYFASLFLTIVMVFGVPAYLSVSKKRDKAKI